MDIPDLGTWSAPDQVLFSGDGKYVVTPASVSGQELEGRSIRLFSAFSKWEKFLRAKPWTYRFDAASRYFYFINLGDSLSYMDLENRKIGHLGKVSTYELEGNLILYRTLDKTYRLLDRDTGKENNLGQAHAALFSGDRQSILLQYRKMQRDSLVSRSLVSGKQGTIYVGEGVQQLAAVGNGFVFGDNAQQIWYYRNGNIQARPVKGVPVEGFTLQPGHKQSADGRLLYVDIVPKSIPGQIEAKNKIGVDVWSYNDTVPHSAQLLQLSHGGKKFGVPISGVRKGVIDLERGTFLYMLSPGENIIGESSLLLVVANRKNIEYNEISWNRALDSKMFMIERFTGARTEIPGNMNYIGLSPQGKYLLYYSPELANYFTYEVSIGKLRNVTSKASTTWTEPFYDRPNQASVVSTSLMWTEEDRSVLLHDFYDYWRIDPAGMALPVNVTSGYGKKNNITFYPINPRQNQLILNEGAKLILSAFNHSNKDNGFYELQIGKKSRLTQLTMGPFLYYAPHKTWESEGMSPKKAGYSDVYVVRRSKANEFPNFYVTRDFKDFRQLTHHAPQKPFNWLTTELFSLKTKTGKPFQSILYKPEDFDPNKKYPVIIYHYERLSGNLNEFPLPALSDGALNIPYFVSNGYLVVTPDIWYRIGLPGRSAFEIVDAVADYLSGLSYVDGTKMGLQGHSHGGYQTNYIVTRTGRFAAACSAAGLSNLIDNYNEIMDDGGLRQVTFYEKGQLRMGTTLWGDIQGYIDQSPIFRAADIRTPMLINANKADFGVHFEQGTQLFLGLRRLGKPAWLLQYDKEGHILISPEAQRDFTIRMKQFFDHYLKGAPAPKWMMEGIPARLKGIDDGLELDKTGRTPGPGLLRTN